MTDKHTQPEVVEQEEEDADAYGRTGERSECWVCNGHGTEYDETCVTCGGFGWIREQC